MLKKERLNIIREYFPNAITIIDGTNKTIDFIEEYLELEPSQIMFADSICSDDVNSIQYPVRVQEFLGPFKMGGLNGYPFTGLTGMVAFASHVPDDGAIFIYYGPHIGITKDGIIGEISRIGQSKNSSCCGAAKGALNKLQNNQITKGEITDFDYQMNRIEQFFFNQKDRILNSKNPILTATEVMYEEVDMRINELVERTKFNCKYIILMGAIIINSDSDMGSYSSVKRFDVINLKKGSKENHMNILTN